MAGKKPEHNWDEMAEELIRHLEDYRESNFLCFTMDGGNTAGRVVDALGKIGSPSALKYLEDAGEMHVDSIQADVYYAKDRPRSEGPARWRVTTKYKSKATGAMKRLLDYKVVEGGADEGYREPRSFSTYNDDFHKRVDIAITKLRESIGGL